MGVTGAGKSTFISQLAQGPIKVGKTLQTCTHAAIALSTLPNPNSGTQVVRVYACDFKDRAVYLIDTPGFDDSNRGNSAVLRELATWLNDSYNNAVKLKWNHLFTPN